MRESFAASDPVTRIARSHGIAPNLLFTWRRLYADAAHLEAGEVDEPVPGSRYRALKRQVRDLEWLLGKKTLENEMLRQQLKLAEAVLGRRRSGRNNAETM